MDFGTWFRRRRVEAGQDRQRLQRASARVWLDEARLFTGAYGRPLVEQLVNRRCHGLCKRAGVPDVSVHGLRHVAASSMLAAGVSPRVVQDILGHRSVAMTLGLYSHVTPALVADAVARVEALVGRA